MENVLETSRKRLGQPTPQEAPRKRVKDGSALCVVLCAALPAYCTPAHRALHCALHCVLHCILHCVLQLATVSRAVRELGIVLFAPIRASNQTTYRKRIENE